MLYRIKTEDCGNTFAVLGIVNKFFDCYSYSTKEVGVWKGIAEPSLIIEIDNVDNEAPIDFGYRVEDVARKIRILNKQQSVLVQKWPVDSKLI